MCTVHDYCLELQDDGSYDAKVCEIAKCDARPEISALWMSECGFMTLLLNLVYFL